MVVMICPTELSVGSESQICHLPSCVPRPSPGPLTTQRGEAVTERQTLQATLHSGCGYVTFGKLLRPSVPGFPREDGDRRGPSRELRGLAERVQ